MRIGRKILFIDAQHCKESFLGNVHLADALHAALPLLLLFEELALACDVASVALGQHVLPHGGNIFSGDNLGADGSLYGYFEKLARNQFSHSLTEGARPRLRVIAMADK